MHEGTITSLRLDKNFGFIHEPGQPPIFFHASSLSDELPFDATLQERRVRYDVVSTAKGERAANVRAAV